MRKMMVAGAALALGLGGAGQAQQTIYWPAPPPAAQQAQMVYFPMGTPLTLMTRVKLSTKVNKPGERVELYVAEALTYHGHVIIPVGAIAMGELAQSDRNGHLGKKGKLALHIVSIETPGGSVRLTGGVSDEGTSGLAASLVTVAFVSPLGVLIHGTSAQLPAGTYVQAYLGEPLRFREPLGAPVAGREAQPDTGGRPLPARFDPAVFGTGATTASR